jgi:hypothetical protein
LPRHEEKRNILLRRTKQDAKLETTDAKLSTVPLTSQSPARLTSFECLWPWLFLDPERGNKQLLQLLFNFQEICSEAKFQLSQISTVSLSPKV